MSSHNTTPRVSSYKPKIMPISLLVKLINENLNNPVSNSYLSIDDLECINILTGELGTLQEIIDGIREILQDGKLNIADLPTIIHLCSIILTAFIRRKKIKCSTFNVIKFVSDTFISSNQLVFQTIDIEKIKLITETSLALLKLVLPKNKKKFRIRCPRIVFN